MGWYVPTALTPFYFKWFVSLSMSHLENDPWPQFVFWMTTLDITHVTCMFFHTFKKEPRIEAYGSHFLQCLSLGMPRSWPCWNKVYWYSLCSIKPHQTHTYSLSTSTCRKCPKIGRRYSSDKNRRGLCGFFPKSPPEKSKTRAKCTDGKCRKESCFLANTYLYPCDTD